MPAFSTHYIFAKELLPFIKEEADFEVNENAVFFGTQGPDIFFFHRVFPWMAGKSLRKTGSALHRAKPEAILENMRDYCNISKQRSIAKSYVWGFFLHYALDRRCHPYVYAMQNKITDKHPLTNPHTAHNLIELSMDAYLLNKRLCVKKPYMFKTAETISPDEKVIGEIGRLYEYVMPRVTGKSITARQAETALRDTITVQKITTDKSGIKCAVITVLETIIAPLSRNFKFSAMLRPRHLENVEKYGNIKNNEWISPADGKKSYDSFEQLFDKAKEEAKEMLTSYKSELSCRDITENLSFLTGVEVK